MLAHALLPCGGGGAFAPFSINHSRFRTQTYYFSAFLCDRRAIAPMSSYRTRRQCLHACATLVRKRSSGRYCASWPNWTKRASATNLTAQLHFHSLPHSCIFSHIASTTKEHSSNFRTLQYNHSLSLNHSD